MIFPETYEGLVRLLEEHGVKLTRHATTASFPECCVIAALAVINGTTYNMLDNLCCSEETYDIALSNKLRALEIGFEGWPVDDFTDEWVDEKFVEIGQQLAKYAGY